MSDFLPRFHNYDIISRQITPNGARQYRRTLRENQKGSGKVWITNNMKPSVQYALQNYKALGLIRRTTSYKV